MSTKYSRWVQLKATNFRIMFPSELSSCHVHYFKRWANPPCCGKSAGSKNMKFDGGTRKLWWTGFFFYITESLKVNVNSPWLLLLVYDRLKIPEWLWGYKHPNRYYRYFMPLPNYGKWCCLSFGVQLTTCGWRIWPYLVSFLQNLPGIPFWREWSSRIRIPVAVSNYVNYVNCHHICSLSLSLNLSTI